MTIPQWVVRDRAALEAVARKMCLTVGLPDEYLLCRVLGKYLMYLEPRDFDITPHLALNGCWEPWVTVALARLIKPGWHCVDVGANVGYYTLLMAEAAGTQGRVLAVEPNPEAAQLLSRNLEVNGFAGRVEIQRCAAGAADDACGGLFIKPYYPSQASLCTEAHVDVRRVDVPMTTLDCLTARWPAVDLVKIDAEGAEPEIWRGMRRLLGCNETIVVLMEFSPARYTDPERFLADIAADGFVLRQVAGDGGTAPIGWPQIASLRNRREWVMLFLARG